MQRTTIRATIGALLSLALAGGLAACGDTTHSGMDHSGMSKTDAPAATTTASAKEIDEAFVRQMIPHHQMAVEMAAAAKTRAEHQEIKDLASEVIEAQTDEVRELRAIAKANGYDLADVGGMMAGDARTLGMDMDDMGMSMRTDDLKGASDFDRSFITMMIPHHEGAIAMAKVEAAKGSDPQLRAIAKAIISAQQTEIAAMNAWHEKWFGEPVAGGSVGSGQMDHGDMSHDDMPGMH